MTEMLKQLIEYACPTCNAGYGSYPEKAGIGTNCSNCKTDFLIPLGLAPKEVWVSESAGRKLSPEEEAEFYDSIAIRTALPNGPGSPGVAVSQVAANSLAKTFLEVILAAIGAVLAAKLGIKKKS